MQHNRACKTPPNRLRLGCRRRMTLQLQHRPTARKRKTRLRPHSPAGPPPASGSATRPVTVPETESVDCHHGDHPRPKRVKRGAGLPADVEAIVIGSTVPQLRYVVTNSIYHNSALVGLCHTDCSCSIQLAIILIQPCVLRRTRINPFHRHFGHSIFRVLLKLAGLSGKGKKTALQERLRDACVGDNLGSESGYNQDVVTSVRGLAASVSNLFLEISPVSAEEMIRGQSVSPPPDLCRAQPETAPIDPTAPLVESVCLSESFTHRSCTWSARLPGRHCDERDTGLCHKWRESTRNKADGLRLLGLQCHRHWQS